MSFFNREKMPPAADPGQPRPRPSERTGSEPRVRTAATYVAPGSRIVGEIKGDAEVLVDGEFSGRIELDNLMTIGKEGKVEGEIKARSVRVEGKVVGNVRGVDRVEVLATGSLEGDISAARVVIAEGAYFKGKVEMTGEGVAVVRKSEAKGGAGEARKAAEEARGAAEVGQQGTMPETKAAGSAAHQPTGTKKDAR